jgi:hypothetical protein
MSIASLESSQKATAMREVLASNDVRTLIANQLGVDVKRVTDERTSPMIWGLTGSTAWN